MGALIAFIPHSALSLCNSIALQGSPPFDLPLLFLEASFPMAYKGISMRDLIMSSILPASLLFSSL